MTLTADSEQNKWLRKCYKASCVGVMWLRLNAAATDKMLQHLLFKFDLFMSLPFGQIRIYYSK